MPDDFDDDQEDQEDPQDLPGLRKHAKDLTKELKALRAQQEEANKALLGYRRHEAFAAAKAEAKVDDVELNELGELPPEQISATLLKAKSDEKANVRRGAEERQAKEMGFDSVDAFRSAMEQIKALDQQKKAELTRMATVATGSPGTSPPAETAEERAWKAWKAERDKGTASDVARSAYVLERIAAAKEASAPGVGVPT